MSKSQVAIASHQSQPAPDNLDFIEMALQVRMINIQILVKFGMSSFSTTLPSLASSGKMR